MTTRPLAGSLGTDLGAEVSEQGIDPEAVARRFASPVRRDIRRMLKASPRVIDLALIFPGALFAIADGTIDTNRRRQALYLVLDGAPLKRVAAALELPMWMRRLPAEAFHGPMPSLPHSEAFSRRIVNCLPTSRAESAVWLKTLAFANEAANEDFAVWLAHQPLYHVDSDWDPRRSFATLAAYAWFSGQPFKAAHGLMIVPWRPEISFETALCAAKSWLNRVRLTLQLGAGVIDDGWLVEGEAAGFCFVPLLSAQELLEEAQGMHNCADQFADRIARDRCRLWSIRRRNGQRLATMEIGQHPREPGVLDIVQLKARHNLPAPVEVWQAAHAWMAGQKGLRRAPPLVIPSRPLDAAGWTALMRPYRES